MNFELLDKIVSQKAEVDICPICGTPYRAYHNRQKTCASEECRRAWRIKYSSELRKRKREQDPEAYRAYRREEARRYRRRKKGREVAERNLDKMEEYWENQKNRPINTDGIDYGKKQAERTLATVPKIDVSGFIKEQDGRKQM